MKGCHSFHMRPSRIAHAIAHTPPEYANNTSIATVLLAYMVSIEMLIRPVATFAYPHQSSQSVNASMKECANKEGDVREGI